MALTEVDQESYAELRYLCKNLLSKVSLLKKEKKVSVIEDLRDIVRRFMIENKTCEFSPPTNFRKKIYEDLIELCSTSDIRAVRSGLSLNVTVKLMVIFLLRILHHYEPYPLLSYQVKDSKLMKTDTYYLNGLLLQKSLDSALKENILNSLKYIDLQGSGVKGCFLFLPSTLQFFWSAADASEISQYLCQTLVLKNHSSAKHRFSSVGSSQQSNFVQTNELDGSVSRDIFTVLSLPKAYNDQHILNVYSFSVLKSWLQFVDNQAEIADCLSSNFNKSNYQMLPGSSLTRSSSRIFDGFYSENDSLSTHSLSSSSSSLKSFDGESNADQLDLVRNRFSDSRCQTPMHLAGAAFDTISITSDILVNSSHSLKSVAIRYCLRLIIQSEKVPKQDSDRSVITASVVEAISVLTILCKGDPILSQRVYPDIKRLYKRIEGPYLSARKVYLALLQFLVNHHADMLMSIDEILDIYFREVPKNYLNNEIACYELVQFCLENKSFCCANNTVLKYIPNIFKIFAWWVCSFLEDGCEFVEMVTNPFNCRELLHIILDLPCLTALLNLKVLKVLDDELKLEEFLGPSTKLYSAMFSFIMRETSNGAETIDKIAELHKFMKTFESNQRVQYSSQTVPLLLKSYFTKLKQLDNPNALKSIYPLMLERIFLLYPQNDTQKKIVKIFSEEVCNIVKVAPDVISIYHCETITLFTQFSSSKLIILQPFLSSIAWCVSLGIESCTDSQISLNYETFETFIYEMLSSFSGQDDPEVICSFISSLSKLAAYMQDLIPRAIVCLGKLSSVNLENCEARYRYTVSFAKELSNILKRPKVAASILCGLYKTTPWHLDPHDSLLMKVHFLTSKFT